MFQLPRCTPITARIKIHVKTICNYGRVCSVVSQENKIEDSAIAFTEKLTEPMKLKLLIKPNSYYYEII